MKRIKQIIEALGVLRGKPSEAIREAFSCVIADAESQAENDDSTASASDHDIVKRFKEALIAIAEDMEKPKAEGEAKA